MQKIFSFATIILVIFLFSDKASGKVVIEGLKGEVKAIVIGFNPTQSEKTGAEELQLYLEKITGEKIPIRNVTGDIPSVSIFVGRSKITDNAGINMADLKPEGFIIKSIPQGLVLIGDDAPGNPFDQRVRAGSLFAVYDFLEKFCQVRWLWPGVDGEVIPHQQNLTIPQVNIKEKPGFIIRSVDFNARYKKKPELITQEWRKWTRRQKMGWVPKMWFGHSTMTHFPPKEYLPTHPEFYALVNGQRTPPQLCTSNKEMQRLLAEKIAHAKADVESISPADGYGFCECENCTALDVPGLRYREDPRFPDLSQRIFTFVNQVAAAVKKLDPNKGVGIFAYTFYRRPPLKIDRLEDNVYISFTYSTAYFNDQECKKDFYEMIGGWFKKKAKMVAREYWGMHYWLDLPVIQIKGIAENLPYIKDKGFVGIYGEGSKNFATMGVNYYLLAKLMWNPHLKAEDILDDYYRSAYGPAAPEMKKYWEFLQKTITTNWHTMELHGRTPGYGSLIRNWDRLLPLEELQKAEKILEQARRQVGNQPDYLHRIDYANYGLKYSQLMIRLLPLYAKLYNSGVKIDFYTVPRLPKTTDENIKQKWLDEAKKLGEEREKMLYSEENTKSFMLNEGLFEYAEHTDKCRPWHTRVLEEWRKTKKNSQ